MAPVEVVEGIAQAAQVWPSDEAIESMIDLRIQLAQVEQQIQALQPDFFAACLALNSEKISLQRATISRRLSPGRWAYSPTIIEQEDLLKHLKHLFKQSHEPMSGREITWSMKLLGFTL